jgi:hypothetical protein
MIRYTVKSILLIAAFGCASACIRSQESEPVDAPRSADQVSVALEIPNGGSIDIDRLTFTLTRPDGYRSSGVIPLANDGTTFNGLLRLPLGTGYQLTASATTATGVMCTGTSTFDVREGGNPPLQLDLQCSMAPAMHPYVQPDVQHAQPAPTDDSDAGALHDQDDAGSGEHK